MKRITDFRHWTTEQVSSRIFYALTGVIVLLFILFRFVGYDIPYDENPDYNAPLLTGVLVWFMILLTFAALAVALWGWQRGVRKSRGENVVINNVPARRIALSVAGGTLAVLLLTFLFSSTDALMVNGESFTDTFWLRTAGMFIGTSVLLILVATGAVVYGATRYIR